MTNGKIVVMGGNGFLGAQICRLAVERRYQVISLGRSDRHPSLLSWTQAVDWVKTDIFNVEDWKSYLVGCDAVIDCVGIAFENSSDNATYERVNEESAKVVAQAARDMHVPSLVYVSAAPQARWVLPQGYIDSKQRAETAVQELGTHWAVLRPGFIYGWGRLWSLLPGRAMRTMSRLPIMRDKLKAVAPLRVEVVAAAALRAAVEPNVAGLLDVPAIAKLGASRLRDWQVGGAAHVA